MSEQSRIIKSAIRMFSCDSARISRPLNKWFLIIMWKRSTKDIDGWYVSRPGEPMKRIDFDYYDQQCVASGDTARELRESMRKYRRLLRAEGRGEPLSNSTTRR